MNVESCSIVGLRNSGAVSLMKSIQNWPASCSSSPSGGGEVDEILLEPQWLELALPRCLGGEDDPVTALLEDLADADAVVRRPVRALGHEHDREPFVHLEIPLRSFTLRRIMSRAQGGGSAAKALAHPLQVGYTMRFTPTFSVHLVDRSVRDIPGGASGCVRGSFVSQRSCRSRCSCSRPVDRRGGETPPADDAATSAGPVDISGTTLTVSNWDLYMPKSVIKGFEEETGVNVEYALHTTNEDIMGKLTAANGTGFDLVFVSGPFVQALKGWGTPPSSTIPDPEPREPRPRGDTARIRPGEHPLGALHVGHDGHLLPKRSPLGDAELLGGLPRRRPTPIRR